MKKRLLSLLLCFILLFCIILPSGSVSADDGGWGVLIPLTKTVYTVSYGPCGDSADYVLYSNGFMRIYGSGAIADYTESSPAPWVGSTVSCVIIDDGITSMGALAFAGVNSFSIYTPDSVTNTADNCFSGSVGYTRYTSADYTAFSELFENGDYCSSHSLESSSVESTAVKKGYTLYQCKDCGLSYRVYKNLKADLNGDGVINVIDLTMLRRHLAGGYTQSPDLYAADINGDGTINTIDLVTLRRYLAGGYGIVF